MELALPSRHIHTLKKRTYKIFAYAIDNAQNTKNAKLNARLWLMNIDSVGIHTILLVSQITTTLSRLVFVNARLPLNYLKFNSDFWGQFSKKPN